MKHNFEERRNNRKNFAQDQAAKHLRQADQLRQDAKTMASAIPMGQPILVGHHSENRDRNYRRKIHEKYGKSFQEQEKAQYYEQKVETIESNDAIYSDDPNALAKLREKLADQQQNHAFMKATNKFLRKGDKEGFLTIPGATPELWDRLTRPSVHGSGFPGYAFQNSNAEIKRLKTRIARLEALTNRTTSETVIKGVRLVENVEANRVQLFFPEIPTEGVRTKLKSRGFRWCRSEGAWQRQLNGNALFTAKDLLSNL